MSWPDGTPKYGGEVNIIDSDDSLLATPAFALKFAGAGVSLAFDVASRVATATIAGAAPSTTPSRRYFENLLAPDTSGSVLWQPASILGTNDLFPTLPFLIFKNTSTLLRSSAAFGVPGDFGTAAKIILRYRCPVNTGNVLWTLDYCSQAAGESGDPSAYQRSLAGTPTAVPGTVNLLADIEFDLTDADLAAHDTLFVSVNRNGAGADTAAADLELITACLQYLPA